MKANRSGRVKKSIYNTRDREAVLVSMNYHIISSDLEFVFVPFSADMLNFQAFYVVYFSEFATRRVPKGGQSGREDSP